MTTAHDGNTLFVGGRFDGAGPVVRTATFDPVANALAPAHAALSSIRFGESPRAPPPVPDGSGGLYARAARDGEPFHLRHFMADGADDPLFQPALELVPLALGPDMIYGASVLDGCAVALERSSGDLRPFRSCGDPAVHAMAFASGKVYESFEAPPGDAPANHAIAVLDPVSAALIGSYLTDGTYGPGPSFLVHGDTVYISGQFGHVNGVPRRCLAALDAASDAVTGFDPKINGVCYGGYSLAAVDDRFFVGGTFDGLTFAGTSVPSGVVELDPRSGALRTFAPHFSRGDFFRVVVTGAALIVTGRFSSVNGVARNNAAAFDLRTDELLDFNPRLNDVVTMLAPLGTNVLAEGGFDVVNPPPRSSLVVFDTAARALRDFPAKVAFAEGEPGVAAIMQLQKHGGRLFARGDFQSAEGPGEVAARPGLAVFDMTTGTLDPFRPAHLVTTDAMLVTDHAVYLAGTFDDTPIVAARAFDPITAEQLPWNPALGCSSYCLFDLVGSPSSHLSVAGFAATDSTVYIFGGFDSAGGVASSSVAAVDAITGAVRDVPRIAMDLSQGYWAGTPVIYGSRLLETGVSYGGDNGDWPFLQSTDLATGEVMSIEDAYLGAVAAGSLYFFGPGGLLRQDQTTDWQPRALGVAAAAGVEVTPNGIVTVGREVTLIPALSW